MYGGENRDKEKSRLRKGVNILVATPGCGARPLPHPSAERLELSADLHDVWASLRRAC